MRKLAWLLIFSYTLLLLNPVMPVLMDLMAHTFWEQQHMLTVHEVNGKFHVHQEVSKAAHHSHKESTNSSKYEVLAYVSQPTTVSNNEPVAYFERTCYPSLAIYFPSSSSLSDYPPPKA